jgi:hypothetical protein
MVLIILFLRIVVCIWIPVVPPVASIELAASDHSGSQSIENLLQVNIDAFFVFFSPLCFCFPLCVFFFSLSLLGFTDSFCLVFCFLFRVLPPILMITLCVTHWH